MDYIKKHKKILIVILLVFIIPIILAYYSGNLKNLFTKAGKTEPKSAPSTKIELYSCPSTSDFCQNGKDVEKDGRYLGFGATIGKGSDIFAAFDGTVTSFTTVLSEKFKKENLDTIYLDNDQKNLRAIYYFKGEAIQSATIVKKGDKLGKAMNKISAFDASVVFQIIKGDLIKGELIKLTTKDFTF